MRHIEEEKKRKERFIIIIFLQNIFLIEENRFFCWVILFIYFFDNKSDRSVTYFWIFLIILYLYSFSRAISNRGLVWFRSRRFFFSARNLKKKVWGRWWIKCRVRELRKPFLHLTPKDPNDNKYTMKIYNVMIFFLLLF